jgi:hypothetical protein
LRKALQTNKFNGRDHLEDIGIGGRIILKWIINNGYRAVH